jgi:hypothetical protein
VDSDYNTISKKISHIGPFDVQIQLPVFSTLVSGRCWVSSMLCLLLLGHILPCVVFEVQALEIQALEIHSFEIRSFEIKSFDVWSGSFVEST